MWDYLVMYVYSCLFFLVLYGFSGVGKSYVGCLLVCYFCLVLEDSVFVL